jgi:hypothetical protein
MVLTMGAMPPVRDSATHTRMPMPRIFMALWKMVT